MQCEAIYLDEEEALMPLPMSWQELDGMRDAAAHYMQHGTKAEKRLARRLARAEAWIRAEANALKQQQADLHIDKVQ